MPRRQKPDARMEDVKAKFIERAEELWDTHEGEFAGVLSESENNTLNLTFVATLDFSESTAKLKTTLSFSQVTRDRKEDDFDDPNQPRLPGTDDDGKVPKRRGKAKGNGRRKKDALETSDSVEVPS